MEDDVEAGSGGGVGGPGHLLGEVNENPADISQWRRCYDGSEAFLGGRCVIIV